MLTALPKRASLSIPTIGSEDSAQQPASSGEQGHSARTQQHRQHWTRGYHGGGLPCWPLWSRTTGREGERERESGGGSECESE